MAAVTSNPITVVEDSPVMLEFRVAVDSNGNTWDTEEVYFMFDDETPLRFTVCDANFPQNYCYTIASVTRFDEGTYTARATSKSGFESYRNYTTKCVTGEREEIPATVTDSIILNVIRKYRQPWGRCNDRCSYTLQ